MLRKLAALMLLTGCSVFMMACPQRYLPKKVVYDSAERKLRMAININELAYNSWNRLYESYGQLKNEGKLNDARWAALQAIDGVIVLTEADLIDGIDRSKKLLVQWQKSDVNLLTAENVQDVATLRQKELDALRQFEESVLVLTAKSIRLRDSYAEVLLVSDKATREGLPLPTEHLLTIRQIVKMVDQEVGRSRPAPKPSPSPAEQKQIANRDAITAK